MKILKAKVIHLMLCFLLLVVMTALLLTGCSGSVYSKTDDRLKVVCTIFPEYDWSSQILGERLDETELVLLLKNGADLHSYQPTVWDMMKISDADLFIYVGGESDFWVADALENVKNPAQITINLMEVLGEHLKEEEYTDGMRASAEEENEEEAYDEHVWLSLKNASIACDAITDALTQLDPGNENTYRMNNENYKRKLKALDQRYEETVSKASSRVLIVGDRFPFRYLTEDYGLTYYAAFSGCAADTEASFETITAIARKADETGAKAVLTIDGSDGKIAKTIASNIKSGEKQVYCLDSMQSVSEDDIRNGKNYITIMEENLSVLKKVLL